MGGLGGRLGARLRLASCVVDYRGTQEADRAASPHTTSSAGMLTPGSGDQGGEGLQSYPPTHRLLSTNSTASQQHNIDGYG